MDSENSFYDLDADMDNWFRDNAGIGFMGNCLRGSHFSDNFQILGVPSFILSIVVIDLENPTYTKASGLWIANFY